MEIAFLFPAHPEKFTDLLPCHSHAIAGKLSNKAGYAIELQPTKKFVARLEAYLPFPERIQEVRGDQPAS